MTREELREHCEKQIEMCEMWAISKGEKPSGKIYEEHKLILELLAQETVSKEVYDHEYFLRKELEFKVARLEQQESVIDKIKAEAEQIEINGYIRDVECFRAGINTVLNIIDKYKSETENT